ncbi:MAG: hypothetical protein NTX81_01320 [Candidatus Bathyarchaeota archaeon]|nr:hypothetical protein [Candidatus Bathyarchaeota archaeon]
MDSKAIADLVRLNALPSAYTPDEETVKLREQVGHNVTSVGGWAHALTVSGE